MRYVNGLSRHQREATPLALARFLVDVTEARAVLWVHKNSVYRHRVWFSHLDLWDIKRDANQYPGPGPIIAHPPCGPWGKYKGISKESRHHGIRAMELVHLYGGVVEQPVGSTLFALHGTTGKIAKIYQRDYGHLAWKPTLLYFVV